MYRELNRGGGLDGPVGMVAAGAVGWAGGGSGGGGTVEAFWNGSRMIGVGGICWAGGTGGTQTMCLNQG